MTSFHLDTDVLVYACARGGPERVHLLELLDVPDPATGTLALKPEYRQRIVRAKDRMVRDGRWKLVYQPLESGMRLSLFDLSTDPGCTVDVAAREPELVALLWAELRDWMAADPAAPLPEGLAILVDIRASQLNGCAFCLDMHVKQAKIHGERELRLHHVAIWHESNLFTPKERAALAWTEALTKIEGEGVSDALYESMLDHFSEAEAFLFHTRLVHISAAMREKDVTRAFDRLSLLAQGVGGGTRIGESLATFNRWHAKSVIHTRTCVMIVSDGYDTGDPEVMAAEMHRLARRCKRIVWLNPMIGWEGYAPSARGMQVALPFIDLFAPAHNLKSLAALEPYLAAL